MTYVTDGGFLGGLGAADLMRGSSYKHSRAKTRPFGWKVWHLLLLKRRRSRRWKDSEKMLKVIGSRFGSVRSVSVSELGVFDSPNVHGEDVLFGPSSTLFQHRYCVGCTWDRDDELHLPPSAHRAD